MLKGKGKITRIGGNTSIREFNQACDKLPENGEFLFVICDEKKNRNLPFLSYFFSVVLKYISDSLPDKPGTTALYKYFELMFAPVHVAEINDQRFEYRDLKTEKAIDVNNVIEKVVEYALNEWGVEVPRNEDLKDPEMRELYSQAYLTQEVDWSSFISSQKQKSKDERRKEI